MKINRRQACGLAAGSLILPARAADAYPGRPVRLIVHTLPGAVSDTTARAVAQEMSPLLGQSIVVENKAGAGGMIGTEFVARSAPDGYTLLAGGSSVIAMLPAVSRRRFSYDPDTDLRPIGMIMHTPYVLVVSARSSHRTLDALVAAARAAPGRLTYGSAGLGTNPHMLFELLCQSYAIRMTHVPYQGPAAAQIDLMGGSIDALFDTPSSVIASLEGGRLRALAASGMRRIPQIPDIATLVEMGQPELHLEGWSALYARMGTPANVLDTLTAAFRSAMESPGVYAAVVDTGNTLGRLMGDEVLAAQRSMRDKWRRIARERNLQIS